MRRSKQKNLKASSSSSVAPQPSPPWVELPSEITTNILQVCSTWWKVCHDPTMWRVIDMKNNGYKIEISVFNKLCRIAVDRSQGQLLKINIERSVDKDLINHIAERSSQLRHLRLVECYCISDRCLAAVAKNFPLLEELHIYFTGIMKYHIKVIGRSCPLLKSFTLNAYGFEGYQSDDEALAIAKNMPELRHLALFGNILTNKGLHAILDGCPHLESLDLRQCYNVDLEGDLGRRCKHQIVDLKEPHDSTYGYEFRAEINDSDSEGYPDPSSDSDDNFPRVYDDFNDYY